MGISPTTKMRFSPNMTEQQLQAVCQKVPNASRSYLTDRVIRTQHLIVYAMILISKNALPCPNCVKNFRIVIQSKYVTNLTQNQISHHRMKNLEKNLVLFHCQSKGLCASPRTKVMFQRCLVALKSRSSKK